MLKIYVESVLQHPLTGEPDRKIIEVIGHYPDLEKVLFDSRSKSCGEFRQIIDFKRVEEG